MKQMISCLATLALVGTGSGVLVHRATVPPLPAGIIMSNEEVVPVNYTEFENRGVALFAHAGVQGGPVYPILNIIATPEGNRVTAVVGGKPRILPIGAEDVAKLDAGEALHMAALGEKYNFDPKSFGADADGAIARLPQTIVHAPPPSHGVHGGPEDVHLGTHPHGGEHEGASPQSHEAEKSPQEAEFDDMEVHEADRENEVGDYHEEGQRQFMAPNGNTPQEQDLEIAPGTVDPFHVAGHDTGLTGGSFQPVGRGGPAPTP